MELGIAGYGKMGRAIERIAMERGHKTKIVDTRRDLADVTDLDCVIEFTHADVAPTLIASVLRQNVPVVSGTTGWNNEKDKIARDCGDNAGSFLWAPNFSVGMHITFAANKLLADLMNQRSEYEVSIEEIHHIAKKDAPSGTAIALAGQITDRLERKTRWALTPVKEEVSETLGITAIRESDVKGFHIVRYDGPHDVISLQHEAKSRDGFALGAVLAAEWIRGRNGVFTFEDVLADLLGRK